jgi:hypothetical protein
MWRYWTKKDIFCPHCYAMLQREVCPMGFVRLLVMCVVLGGEATAEAGNRLTFDCVLNSDKAGEIGTICAVFSDRLAAAFPGRTVHRSDEAEVLLVVEAASPKTFVAHIAWRGHGKGPALGVAIKGGALGDRQRADLIDSLLKASGR